MNRKLLYICGRGVGRFDNVQSHMQESSKSIRRIAIIPGQHLPFPPDNLLESASLFLDLDGTLLELIDRPDEVIADAKLRALLVELASRLDGRLAVISGRSLEQVDAILGDVAADLAVSGSHGCEHRWRGVLAHPTRPETLDVAAARMRDFINGRSGLLVEEKSFGVALHYRMNPETETAVHSLAAELSTQLALAVQHGKMMVELRVDGGDKGRAVHRLMSRPPMSGTRPVFVGDDVTDEPGFVAARDLGGHGILIGTERATAADYRIDSPAGLRAWLEQAIP